MPPITMLLALGLSVPALLGPQWPTDLSQQLVVGQTIGGFFTPVGEDLDPVAAAGPDGSTWVAWSASTSTGYDQRLQRLDAAGNRAAPPAGFLLASFPGVTNPDPDRVDLCVDATGAAHLVLPREPQGVVHLAIAADGSFLTPPGGEDVDTALGSYGAARVAVADDGRLAFAWVRDGELRVRQVADDGTPVGPTWVRTSSGADVFDLDLLTTAGGDFVAAWSESFTAKYVQRFDASGAAVHGPVGVELTGGVAANGLRAVVDGDGLAVAFGAQVQRVAADGSLAYPGGIALWQTADFPVGAAAIDVDPGTGDLFAAQKLQSQFGSVSIRAQRVDLAGQRLWSDAGVKANPGFPDYLSHPAILPTGDGSALVTWANGLTGQFSQRLWMRELGPDGSPTVSFADQLIASGTNLYDVVTLRGSFGQRILVHSSDPNGDSDVFAVSVGTSGDLGPAAGAVGVAAPGNPLLLTVDVAPLGGTLDLALDLAATGHGLGAVFATLGGAALPVGGQLLLVDPAGPELLGAPVVAGPDAAWTLPLPDLPALLGLGIRVQGAGLDPAMPFVLSDGYDVQLGV